MNRPPINRLLEVLSLDESTGVLTWKAKVAKKIMIGQVAGTTRPDGYGCVCIDKMPLLRHHIVFAMTNNRWPKEIDHINGNPSDNRPSNLREATRRQNTYNTTRSVRNKSGYKGVFTQARGKTWYVRLTVDGKKHRLGGFETKELANEFCGLMRVLAHGQFANNGAKAT